MTFENQYELENYVSARDYPKELRYEMFEAMEKVRECINGGAYDTAFAIAETEEEKRQRQTGVFSPLPHFFIIEIITQKLVCQ